MKDKEKQNKVFDILDKMEFFQGQRAGRELWNDKSKEVQDKDISDFIKDINYIRSYLQDSVVLSKEEYNDLILAKKTFASDGEEVSSDALLSTFKGIKEQECKETAEKILRELYSEATSNVSETAELTTFQIEQLAKQYGVEVEE